MRFLIISTSARAIAESAYKAGFSFDVIDQFADWDLEETCKASSDGDCRLIKIKRFSELFEGIDLRRYGAAVIAGGFESHVNFVRQLEENLSVLGCPADQLERLCSVTALPILAQLTTFAGANWPLTHDGLFPPPSRGPWLLKDMKGSGGKHIRKEFSPALSLPPPATSETRERSWIYQQPIQGQSYSALYCARPRKAALHAESQDGAKEKSGKPNYDRMSSSCQLIGCTQQWVGDARLGASPFGYCGSIGPIFLKRKLREVLSRLGQSISHEFDICGIFGIDFLLNENGIWPVDVNPRIPASAEIYELSSSRNEANAFSVFRAHVESAQNIQIHDRRRDFSSSKPVGKAILFSRHHRALCLGDPLQIWLDTLQRNSPNLEGIRFADIPNRGAELRIGDPILSILATGNSPNEVKARLLRAASEIESQIPNLANPTKSS
jgi:uncharacterized protein